MQGPATGMEGHRTQLWEWRDEEIISKVGEAWGGAKGMDIHKN